MKVRHSQWEDLDEIRRLYDHGREIMRTTGNPHQWRATEPQDELLQRDIRDQVGYVVEDETGHIGGAFAIESGEDPAFGWIDGSWPNDEPYMTIHRIVSDETVHGIFHLAVETARGLTDNVRLDTSLDNKIIQHLSLKHGFVRCGVVLNRYNEPRVAFHKDFRWDKEESGRNDGRTE